MKKPWVMGLLSIVPGLALIVLGEVRKGLAAAAVVVLLVSVSFLLIPSETLSITGFTLALIAWITQGYYAVVLAQRLARSEAGSALPVRQVTIAPLPPGAAAADKRLHEVRQIVMGLLAPGEHLRLALHATTGNFALAPALIDLAAGMPPVEAGSVRQLYLGLTEEDLIVVKMDPFGQPSELQRVPLTQVTLCESKEGLLSDELVIGLGAAEPLRVAVGRPMHEAAQQLAAIISSKEYKPVERERPLGQRLSAAATSGAISSHPMLLAALVGAIGGILGALVAALLSSVVSIFFGEALTGSPDFAEGLGILLGLYCLIMFPIGGAILGAIPGTITAALRGSVPGERTLLPPALAGFLTVVILSLAGLAAMLLA